MKAVTIIKGKLVFLEGEVDEVCRAVEQLGLSEMEFTFLQPLVEPSHWEAVRDYIKGVISL